MIDGKTSSRFWGKVDKRGPGDCWEWQASVGKKGYGYFYLWGKWTTAHRACLEMILCGRVGGDMLVCHVCDNPPCVNPAHLFLGTAQDNTNDMMRKGRHVAPEPRRGADGGNAKLTEEQVNNLRRDYVGGMTYRQLGNKYGTTNIGRIVRNESYHDPDYTPINAQAKPRPWLKKWDNDTVGAVVEAHKRGESQREIERKTGVSRRTIKEMIEGEY